MEILCYPAGIYDANCYIVYDEASKEGFVIDPGGDAEGIFDAISSRGIKVKFILLTHGHFDHTGGVNELKSKLNVPAYISEKDKYLISGEHSLDYILLHSDKVEIDGFIKDGDILHFGGEELEIIETPGHTPGGVTVKVKDALFTGDTLFAGSVGRSDLPGGSHEMLIQSIKDKLVDFPDDTVVYPGHGPSSTMGREKAYNPFL